MAGMMTVPKVCIIVLNWNRKNDTVECIESLTGLSYPSYEIVLVDNGSTDGTVDYVAEHYPGVIVVNNEKNLGYAGGNNRGLREAANRNADYFLILNNDTVVDRNFLNEPVALAEKDSSVGLVQSKLLYYDDGTINTTGNICDHFGWAALRGRLESDLRQYDGLTDAGFFYASGACLLVRRKLYEDLGGELFDERLFAYHEDVDLSWEARLLGYKVTYCPGSVCYHKEGKTSGRFTPGTAYWVYRNRLRVLLKNYSLANCVAMVSIATTLGFLTSIVTSTAKADPGYLVAYARGVGWNLLNLRDTLDRRRRIQSNRKIGDGEIMARMTGHSLEYDTILKKGVHQFLGKLYSRVDPDPL